MKQLCRGKIFVNHATNFIFINRPFNLTAATTVVSKHKCESKFDGFGIQIKQYVSDNHPFRSEVWVEDCAVQLQLNTLHYGVGAQHQVLAERHKQTIFNRSRAELLHFVPNWPMMATIRENISPIAPTRKRKMTTTIMSMTMTNYLFYQYKTNSCMITNSKYMIRIKILLELYHHHRYMYGSNARTI